MNDVIPMWDQLPDLSWREKIAFVTHQMLTMEQTDCPLTHKFDGQLYIREIRLPKGTLLTGRVHRHGHVCQLLEGTVTLVHQQGARETFQAPSEIMTLPGYQMVVYALEDSLARTIHPNPTNERDIDKLEADIFEPAEATLLLGKQLHQEYS
jgi:hypothetical protein